MRHYILFIVTFLFITSQPLASDMMDLLVPEQIHGHSGLKCFLEDQIGKTRGTVPADEDSTGNDKGASLEMFDFDYDFDDKTPLQIDSVNFEYFSLKLSSIQALTFSPYLDNHFSPPDNL